MEIRILGRKVMSKIVFLKPLLWHCAKLLVCLTITIKILLICEFKLLSYDNSNFLALIME